MVFIIHYNEKKNKTNSNTYSLCAIFILLQGYLAH